MAGRKKQDVSAPPKKPTRQRSPVATKADLEAAIAPLATKAELAAAIAPLATKAEIAQLATKAEIAQLATKAEITQLATRAEMYEALDAWAQRLREVINQDMERAIARHIGAAMEQMQVWISTLDDKYSGLPGRVSAIERRLDGNGK